MLTGIRRRNGSYGISGLGLPLKSPFKAKI